MAPNVAATNAHCGQTLTASLTLNGDLTCSGNGDALTVSGNNVVLNLNGHELAGSNNSGIGVVLNGTSDTVENGVITNFFDGVDTRGTTDTVLTVRATYNKNGILDFRGGTGTKITNSVAASNTYNGIYSDSTGAVFSGDHVLNNGVTNGYAGMYLAGQKQTVTGSVADGNGGQGIDDQGFGNTLTKNVANFNHQDGINAFDATVTDGGGNSAKGNDYASGATPEQCNGVVCS